MPSTRRGKRRRSSTSNANANSKNNKKPNGHDKADEDSDQEETDIHVLDGIEYKNYNDFVFAKRKRNERYLRDLGFDNTESKTKGRPSATSAKKTETTEETTTERLTPKRAKIVSPASSYYERYVDSDGTFGISLDSVSLNQDCFREISALLLTLEEEHAALLQLSLNIDVQDETDSAAKGLNETIESTTSKPSGATAPAVPESIPTNESTTEDTGGETNHPATTLHQNYNGTKEADTIEISDGMTESEGKITNEETPGDNHSTALLTETPDRNKESTALKTMKLKLSIQSSLQKLLSFLSTVPTSGDLSLREKYLQAFHQLKGLPLMVQLLGQYSQNDDTESCDIVILCLGILRDAFFLSTLDIRKSTAEKVALEMVDNSGLGMLHTILSSLKTVATTHSSKTKPKLDPMSKDNQNKTLECIRNAWSVCANLTYFESVTAKMGRAELLKFADLAHWTLTALDYHVTETLSTILPSIPEKETKIRSGKKQRRSKSNTFSSMSTTVATASPEAMDESKKIANETCLVLEPVLGTLRNLVADPIVTPIHWESKDLVSNLLNVVCKGDEDMLHLSTTETKSKAHDNDWFHFVKQQSLHSASQESETIVAIDTHATVVFRWMEQSESAVWELLGIFKVFLRKGILSTCTDDDRLVAFWIRCLQRFGSSSSRITLRILSLVGDLVFPSASMNTVYGDTSKSADIWKQTLRRKGFLPALLDLCDRLGSSFGDSGDDKVRTEIDSMIARI